MISFLPDEPLKDKTSYKIGGPTRWYFAPVNDTGVTEAIERAGVLGAPVLVMGKGSNILISDSGWPGLVLHFSTSFAAVEWNNATVVAQGGATLDTVVRESVHRGLRGLEDLSGIPGSVGGAVVMNAGAYSACIADTLLEATYLDMEDNRIVTVENSGLAFGYRDSLLRKKKVIVLSARFGLQLGTSTDLERSRIAVLEKRKKSQPLDIPSCGSVFKRPPGNYAGALIERAGLKGLRFGGAEISSKHANFIVNRGNATAAEVRHLIVLAQRRVYESTGILLEPEVVFAGEFEEALFVP
jgi:UDP-N-acetylmuramate dehydrogenase